MSVMNVGQFFTGIGLLAGGVTFGFACWYGSDFDRARRAGERRWWLDRRVARRRGLTKDEWLDRFAKSQRKLVKYFALPFMAVWCALVFIFIVHAF